MRPMRLTHLDRKRTECVVTESLCMSNVFICGFCEIGFFEVGEASRFLSLWVNGFWVLEK